MNSKILGHFFLIGFSLALASCAKYRISGGAPQSPIVEQGPSTFGPDSGFTLSANPGSGPVNTLISFEFSSPCPGLSTINYGDGASGSQKNHVYTQPGTFTAFAECQEPEKAKLRSQDLSIIITNGSTIDPTQQNGGGNGCRVCQNCPSSCSN